MTKAARNALAWVHLRKRMPKHLHDATWRAVYDCTEYAKYDRVVKAECLPLVVDHPMVVKARELEADGWKIDTRDRNYKVRYGVTMIRPALDRLEEINVWLDGHTS